MFYKVFVHSYLMKPPFYDGSIEIKSFNELINFIKNKLLDHKEMRNEDMSLTIDSDALVNCRFFILPMQGTATGIDIAGEYIAGKLIDFLERSEMIYGGVFQEFIENIYKEGIKQLCIN